MSFDENQSRFRKMCRVYAERTRRTVFFVGSGCSIDFGFPTWQQIRDNIYDEVRRDIGSFDVSDDTQKSVFEIKTSYENDSHWEFFGKVREKIGSQAFEEFIRLEFEKDRQITGTPKIYEKIWSNTTVRQVFTLNIDGLVKKSLRKMYGEVEYAEYDGFELQDSRPYYDKNRYCIYNLHGTVEKMSRVVFTKNKLDELHARDSKYISFMSRIISNCNIIMLGISADDVAIGSIFEKMIKFPIDMGNIFWISDRTDDATRSWARIHGVELITYSPEIVDGRQYHDADLCTMVEIMSRYRSEDNKVISLPSSVIESDKISPVDELQGLCQTDVPRVRSELSSYLLKIQNDKGMDSVYVSDFLEDYDIPIKISSVVSKKEPFNNLFGWTVGEQIESEGSSEIWSVSKDGEMPAVAKILPSANLKDRAEMQSFRRGIESIFTLNKNNFPFVPNYIDHFSIPPSIVMEYIYGENIQELVERKSLDFFNEGLIVFRNLCNAIRQGHLLEESVLHRDIRPSNIMLPDIYLYGESSQYRVILLNFDMSWHKYTRGITKRIDASDIGFSPPELKKGRDSDFSRRASTDVYMLGMLLYYLRVGESPPEGGVMTSNWTGHLREKFRPRSNENTLALRRLSRIVESATHEDPESRLGLDVILHEIETVFAILHTKWESCLPDVWVERLMDRTGREYDWDDAGQAARIRSAGAIVGIYIRQNAKFVFFEYSRVASGDSDRFQAGPAQKTKIDFAENEFRNRGWEIEYASGRRGDTKFLARIRTLAFQKEWNDNAIMICRNIEKFLRT